MNAQARTIVRTAVPPLLALLLVASVTHRVDIVDAPPIPGPVAGVAEAAPMAP